MRSATQGIPQQDAVCVLQFRIILENPCGVGANGFTEASSGLDNSRGQCEHAYAPSRYEEINGNLKEAQLSQTG
jgi:hypothetical protein